VDYRDRYCNGETISTAFIESTVNEVISKRFVKKQQMRWTKEGAHHLLQIRIQVLNDELQQTFCKWYPGILETPIDTEGEKQNNQHPNLNGLRYNQSLYFRLRDHDSWKKNITQS
jgi:hypothetical protein